MLAAHPAIETIGVLAGLGYVVLAIRESVWCWPSGLVSAVAYVVVFEDARLPGQAVLQAILAVVCIYGWWSWRRGKESAGGLVVSRAGPATLAAVSAATAVSALGIGLLLRHSTQSVLPFWDAGILAASLSAQAMAARKLLENWLVWIGVNVVSIGLYVSQGLVQTTGLYIVYLVMAIVGYRAWKRSLAERA
jgi:nicotinamide mononucleotide transporter